MLEIFQSGVQREFRTSPTSPDFAQTIENTIVLETLGFQREPNFTLPEDALRASIGRKDSQPWLSLPQ